MTSKPASAHRTSPFSLLVVSILAIFITTCGLIPTLQPTASPAVTTVPPPTDTQPPDTVPPATATSTEAIIRPTETLAPPPPPDFPQVSRGGPNGDNQDKFRSMLDFTPSYFLRMYVFYSEDPSETFDASKDGRGIQTVEFTVTSPDGSKRYYDHTEKNAGYCLFGGGEPDCNQWTLEGGRYVWKPGGPAVRSGKYALTINVTAQNGDVGTWIWNEQEGNPIVINLP
jgi:hypothetical protein